MIYRQPSAYATRETFMDQQAKLHRLLEQGPDARLVGPAGSVWGVRQMDIHQEPMMMPGRGGMVNAYANDLVQVEASVLWIPNEEPPDLEKRKHHEREKAIEAAPPHVAALLRDVYALEDGIPSEYEVVVDLERREAVVRPRSGYVPPGEAKKLW
jgi:hypothetical protein